MTDNLEAIGMLFGTISLVIGFIGTIIVGGILSLSQWLTMIVFGFIYVILLTSLWVTYAIYDSVIG